jgi:hypothetical protein
MICPNCGFQVGVSDKNCRNCNTPLNKKQKNNKLIHYGAALLAGVGLIGVLFFGGLMVAIRQELNQTPARVNLESPVFGSYQPYFLSQAQIQEIESHGYPDSFSLLFYQQSDETGNLQSYRHESWTYAVSGLSLTFINGALIEQEQGEPIQNPYHPTAYRPEQFSSNMSLEEVLSSSGVMTYLTYPLEQELVPNSDLYYAQQLIFGLKDNQLRYLETVLLEEASP